MTFSRPRVGRPLQREYAATFRFLAAILVAAMAVPMPQVLAEPASISFRIISFSSDPEGRRR
ncbi:MAG: hypothetical protein AABN34_28795, partial [Acidobacteriota bacterium]